MITGQTETYIDFSIKPNIIVFGDCLDKMSQISDKSINMILVDPPFGSTTCSWDIIIPFDKLWEQYRRIIKDNGAILIFGTEPFSSMLRLSNLDMYRYDIVWDKMSTTNFANAKKMPLSCTENISVFYKKLPTYNPIMSDADPKKVRDLYVPLENKSETNIFHSGITKKYSEGYDKTKRYPTKLIRFSSREAECNAHNKIHPAQKPVRMLEYLIKLYSNEDDVILDSCMGVGSTGVAALGCNRNFIGIEKNEEYFKHCKKRLPSFNTIE